MLSRRSFMRGTAAAVAAGVALKPRVARACPSPNTKILEIFCCGGFSHWDVVRPSGLSTAGWNTVTPATDWATVAGSDAYAPGALGTFPYTPSGANYTLDKAGAPLRKVPTSGVPLHAKLRAVAVGHTIEAHEPAVVHALTGSRLGRPNACGLGAAIQHYYTSLSGPDVYSVILEPAQGGATYESRVASLSGALGPEHTPIVAPLYRPSSFSQFLTSFDRGTRDELDGLRGLYRDRYAQALTHTADGQVRSKGFSAYDGALSGLRDHVAVHAVLASATPAPVSDEYVLRPTRSALRYAVDLLHSGNNVRHVCVLDHGIEGRGYDTHNGEDTNRQGRNLWSLMRALAELHGENKLDDILVVVRSEFSRAQDDSTANGTEHWPWGTAALFLAGPITTAALVGSYTLTGSPAAPYANEVTVGVPGGGTETRFAVTPADIQAVSAWAAGIADPFPHYTDLDLTSGIRDRVDNLGESAADATAAVACDLLGL